MTVEQKDHNYCSFGEVYLRYRKVVAEWMIDVCKHFKLHNTTAHAAVAYLDRLQPNDRFNRFEWQMLAISCIIIASKFNECEDHVPCLRYLEDITQQEIRNETLLSYELWALKRMGWKLNARTPMAFLYCHMVYENGLIKDDDVLVPTGPNQDEKSIRDEAEHSTNLLVVAMATSCLLNVDYKSYLASDVAKAIIFVARERLVNLRSAKWTATLDRDVGPIDTMSVLEIISRLKSEGNAGAALPIPPPMNNTSMQMHVQDKKASAMMSPTSVDDAMSPYGKQKSTSSYHSSNMHENNKENYDAQSSFHHGGSGGKPAKGGMGN